MTPTSLLGIGCAGAAGDQEQAVEHPGDVRLEGLRALRGI